MAKRCSCGLSSWVVQYTAPVWEPLRAAVGERLVETFMWMHEEELDDGSVLHAYKHIHTRRYLNLTPDGRAFACAPCGGYMPLPLGHAIEAALCTWALREWTTEDGEAVSAAIERAWEGEDGADEPP
jgi:hypothetical protein